MHRIASGIAATAVLICVLLAGAAHRAPAATSLQWFKADFHVHSVVSAEAFPDLGVLTSSAKANGFNAIFLTDHNLASNFPISGMTANHMYFEDTYRRWTAATTGSLSSSTNQLASAPVASGTASLHLGATSSTAGESFVWTKRGPNFRAATSDPILKFKVFPARLDAGSGIYVSAAIGGDPTVKTPANNPVGYTTTEGVVSPGKAVVFVFYFGTPPPASFYGTARVVAYDLAAGHCSEAFALNTWISCTVNLREKLADLDPADRPLAYNGVSNLKLATVAQAGTADAYFDSYSIDATSSSAEEFIDRNAIIGSYDTSTFKLFPAVEMGISEHANRFNFDIDDASEFTSYHNGKDGIRPTQESGYPAQLNHPGVDGGVSDRAAIDTNAAGADLLEVRQQNMLDDWDAILRKGVPIVGTWGSDNHNGRWTLGSQASFIAASELSFDELMHSIFEGRAYLAPASFTGGFVLNLDASSQEPYPARYPVYVSPSLSAIPVHARIGASLRTGDTVKWLAHDAAATATAALATDVTTGAAYEATKPIPLGGESAYVRAEVRSSSGAIRALSEPILFKDVPGLPADLSYHVERVTTPSGRDYTKIATQGITATSWDDTARALTVELKDPAGSLVELRGTSASRPFSVSVGGITVEAAPTLTDFAAASSASWYHDPASSTLYLKVLHDAAIASLRIAFADPLPDPDPDPDPEPDPDPDPDPEPDPDPVDAEAPTVPSGLAVTGTTLGSISLEWSASMDNVGVTGYTVYRDGSAIGTTTSTTFTDIAVSPATTYTYAIDAYDEAGNRSAQSVALSAATAPAPPQTITLVPTDDSYVSAATTTTAFGGNAALYVDGDPVRKSYLRFDLSAVTTPVTKATLEIRANSAQSVGYFLFGVEDNGWNEAALVWDNQPTNWNALPAGASGPVTAGAITSVDVTSLVQAAGGSLSLGLSTPHITNLGLASSESATPPKLILTTG